jgi:hypothetical protein
LRLSTRVTAGLWQWRIRAGEQNPFRG